ncbi:hypothetical protein [Corynebacterium sp.]|uniref:hypothetical protein n=1 Tax=Corynebacterium sp. TaxID=1720 RepID=UPI0026E09FC0|nr:hypothetical protein [Corynebacterium sp.]MDO5513239.1 hypothetical protein [Corynebacterium sp.]
MQIRKVLGVVFVSMLLAAFLAGTLGGATGLVAGVVVAVLGLAVAVTGLMRQPAVEEPDPASIARRQHREVLDEYARWELDPEMLLRYPGLWDRSRPEVHRFFDALALAGRQESGDPEVYVESVAELRMAWAGAERYARSTGTSALEPTRRTEAETGLKLYRHAQRAATEAERATYYRRALETVRSLIDAGLLPRTLPAVERLETLQRGELT